MSTASINPFNAVNMANVAKASIYRRLNKYQAATGVLPPTKGASYDATETMINLAWGMADLDDCVCRIAAHEFQHPKLGCLLEYCGGTFTPGTVASIGMQIADRMQQIHVSGVVHRDIDPSNFCLGPTSWNGSDGSSTFFLIDRGTARCIGAPEEKGHPAGNIMFMSVAAHMGRPVGPWDELQSVSFMLFFFLVGKLPWQNLDSPSRQLEMAEACIMKEVSSPVDLGVENFEGFVRLYEYILRRPADIPCYTLIRGCFNDVLRQVGELDRGVFDWERVGNRH